MRNKGRPDEASLDEVWIGGCENERWVRGDSLLAEVWLQPWGLSSCNQFS